jgi:hypothetical protein
MAIESQYLLVDRRQARRYRLALPVEVGDCGSQTRNISTSGAFLELDTDRRFSLGEPVSFTLRLEHAGPDHPVHLQCQGAVVRVERHNGRAGVAVHITSVRFA